MSLEYAEDNAEDNARVLDGRRMSFAIEADRRLYARRERLARFTTAKLCDAAGTVLPCVMIAAFALSRVMIAALSRASIAALPCVMVAALPCVMRRVREIASRERQALSLRGYISTSRPLFVPLSVLTDVQHRRYKTDSQTLANNRCAPKCSSTCLLVVLDSGDELLRATGPPPAASCAAAQTCARTNTSRTYEHMLLW